MIKALAAAVTPEDFSFGFSLCPHVAFCPVRVPLASFLFLRGPTLMTSSKVLSEHRHVGIRASTYEFGGGGHDSADNHPLTPEMRML